MHRLVQIPEEYHLRVEEILPAILLRKGFVCSSGCKLSVYIYAKIHAS